MNLSGSSQCTWAVRVSDIISYQPRPSRDTYEMVRSLELMQLLRPSPLWLRLGMPEMQEHTRPGAFSQTHIAPDSVDAKMRKHFLSDEPPV